MSGCIPKVGLRTQKHDTGLNHAVGFYSTGGMESKVMLKLWIISLSLLGFVSGQGLDETPQNTAVLNGNGFSLSCAKRGLNVNVKINWRDPSGLNVAVDGEVLPNTGYTVQYNGDEGTSVLTASKTEMKSGGNFQCALNHLGSTGYIVSADLIVLAKDSPDCFPSLVTDPKPIVVEEGDHVEYSCELGYSGEWPPAMTFTTPDGTVLQSTNETVFGLSKYTVKMAATDSLHLQKVICRPGFQQRHFETNHAENIPSFVFQTCNTQVYYVQLPVNEERIKIEGNQYVGETITCSAPGIRPKPGEVQWLDVNGTMISKGKLSASFTIHHPGTYNYECHVGHFVGSEEKWVVDKKAYSFTASESVALGSGIIAAIVVGCVVFVIIIVAVCVLCYRKQKAWEEDQDIEEKPKGDASMSWCDECMTTGRMSPGEEGTTTPQNGQPPQDKETSIPLIDKPTTENSDNKTDKNTTYANVPNTTDNRDENNVEGLVYAQLDLDKGPRINRTRPTVEPQTDYAEIVVHKT